MTTQPARLQMARPPELGESAAAIGADRNPRGVSDSIAQLLDQLDVIASASGGIDRLRKLVLELAIRGQLSAPRPDDPPAAELLEAARLDREAKLRAGTARHMGTLSPVEESECRWTLPSTWSWTRIGLAMNLVNGRAFKPSDWTDTGLPIVRIQNLNNPDAPFNFCKLEVEPKFHLRPGDFLISWSGTPGTSFGAFIWNGPAGVLNQHIFRAEVYGAAFDLRFLRIAINARLDEMIAQAHGGVGLQHITKGKLEALPIPVPPLPEQKRIVAKVNQFIALCDELEVKQATQRKNEDRVAKAALGALTSAETREELEIAWARVSANFDPLTARHDSVAALSNAVLWLATHGRFGTSRPSDESAGSLLEEIRAERRATWEHTRLVEMRAAGTVARTDAWKARYRAGVKANPSDPLVTGIPPHWRIASLDEVAEVIDPNPSHRYPSYTNGCVPLLSTREFDGRDGWKPIGPNVPLVPREVHAEQAARCRFAPRDIILARKGRLGLARHPPRLPAFVFSHTLFVIKPAAALNPDYLLWFLRLEEVVRWFRREMNDNTGVPTLGKSTTEQLPVPLPPREEQDRIVKVIERAMALCEQLEASLHARAERAARFTESLVAAIHE